MDKPLYALHSDLEMIATQVQILSGSLNKLDWIVHRMKKLDDELTCQGEQMRRIEKWMYGTDEKIQTMGEKIQGLEDRMQGVEKLLILICKKLKIKIPT